MIKSVLNMDVFAMHITLHVVLYVNYSANLL